ncbi:MAG: transglutaminase-like domain-containing protein [Thermodesulfobacteriota bacterium]
MKAFKNLLIFTLIFANFHLLSSPNSQALEESIEENWMGIYSDDKRVGFSHTSILRKDGFTKVYELTNFKINLLGEDREVFSEATYKLQNYKILTFEYEMSSDNINLKARGNREDKGLAITLETVSGKSERFLSIDRELVLLSLVPEILTRNNLRPADEYEFSIFEPLSVLMGINVNKSTHRIGNLESIEIPLGKFDTYKVISDLNGVEIISWITSEGKVIKQESPPDLVAIRESKKDILDKKNKSFNIIQKTSIPSNKKIKDPSKLQALTIKLGGIDFNEFKLEDGYRQKIIDDYIVIESKKPVSKEISYTLPYKFKEFREYTQADFLIQSDDEEIIQATNKILDGERNPKTAAKKINNWIYKNIKKSPTVSLPNAKDVLNTKVGDCNEHAALFSAMARAAGIPTKTVLGVMYYDNSFYYHAWNEVLLDNWVAVDSTYGQFPADATHIKLIEGNFAKSAEISKLVGKLNIEIIDAS